MVLKKHTAGITYTIIGMLFPFFSSVCLASSEGNNLFSSNYVNLSENSISIQKDEVPQSDLFIKPDIDFINRLKNYRIFYRNDHFPGGVELNYIPHPEVLPSTFILVPRPAYYNYLFMFKPFE